MLPSKTVQATIAVKDLARARDFYELKLGFVQAESQPDVYVSYHSGNANFLVYKSEFAGGYKATVATWDAGSDTESLVADLKAAGIEFEDYGDMPDSTRQGDLYISGDMKMAWFKDPDGNILCVVGT